MPAWVQLWRSVPRRARSPRPIGISPLRWTRTIYRAIARCSERATTANIACSPASQIETRGELYMRNALPAVALALSFISPAHAQTDVLIQTDSRRTDGLFT